MKLRDLPPRAIHSVPAARYYQRSIHDNGLPIRSELDGTCAYRELSLILQGLLPAECNDVTCLMRELPHRGRSAGMMLIQRLVGPDDVLISYGSTKQRSGA